jgi:esterase
MSNPILNFVEFGDKSKPAIVILHGFLGSSKNWVTISKILSESFRVIAVDLRNHGDSFHHDKPNYDDMASDILHLLNSLHLEKITLMGHSMGGKVAMKFACLYPNKIENLIVIDIAPKQYFPHRNEVVSMLAIDLSQLKSKQDAENQLEKDVPDLGLRKFLLTNLVQENDGRFRWKVNLPVFSKEISNLGANPLSDNDQFLGRTLFILGGKSDFVKEFDYPILYKYFPNADIEVIENSDHNPHFSTREKFLEIITSHLQQ